CHGRRSVDASAVGDPRPELGERHDFVVVGEPSHLPLETIARDVESARSDAVCVVLDHVVVTEDDTGILQPATDGGYAKGPETVVVRGRAEPRRAIGKRAKFGPHRGTRTRSTRSRRRRNRLRIATL